MTDREKLEAIAADIPGDAASWQALADKVRAMMPGRRPAAWTLQAIQREGDGTLDAKMWGHLRNLDRALQEFAFVLGAMERGDDPDIPF